MIEWILTIYIYLGRVGLPYTQVFFYLAVSRGLQQHNFTLLLLASSDFCCVLINFANSFDPVQNVGPDLDPNHLTH